MILLLIKIDKQNAHVSATWRGEHRNRMEVEIDCYYWPKRVQQIYKHKALVRNRKNVLLVTRGRENARLLNLPLRSHLKRLQEFYIRRHR